MKSHFPIFKQQSELIYLDSAATAQKPQVVIDAVTDYLGTYSANVGRGLYPLATKATVAFESAREKVATFIHALQEEIIFTSGTTESINLAAKLLTTSIQPSSNIVVTELEHHSNFLPWKELARSKGIEIRITPCTDEGLIDIEALTHLIDKHTSIVAFTAISNVTGGIHDVAHITSLIREKNPNTIIVIDAAQAIGHIPIDAKEWDADFIAFSGHKAYGPTGIGVLCGKKELLEHCSPVTFGGGMVIDSCTDIPEYREIPYRFEAGTPNIEGAIGLGAAIDFISSIGIETMHAHDMELAGYAIEKLRSTFGDSIRIFGPSDIEKRSSLISFTIDGMHPHDLAELLGEKNICIRAGEHCAAPLHQKLNLPATARVSFGIYTDTSDIDRLITEMSSAIKILNS